MLYTNIQNWYEVNNILHNYMNFSLEDIYNMYPYEKELYMLMHKRDKEEEKAKMEEQKQKMKR